MKYVFIVNPAAGKGKHFEEVTDKIKKACEKLGAEYEIYVTAGVGDATEQVKLFANKYPEDEITFFACGGDGTLCEVVNGAMAVPDRDRLYIGTVPAGTGNDFVRNYSESQIFGDIEAQLSGSDMKIDLIDCNGLYAVNMINIGFDCEVVCKKAELQKHKIFPSKLAYIAGLIITLIRKPGVNCRMSLDGGEYSDRKLLLTTFGNGEYCGGGFHSNPESSVCNGKINALTVNNISRMKFISIVGKYKKGTHLVYTDILQSTLANTVDMQFDSTTNISVDGEIVRVDGLHLQAVKDAVNFVLPKGVKYVKQPTVAEALV